MDGKSFRRWLTTTPVAALAAVPHRARQVARYDWPIVRESATWLVRSREYTNWTYGLSELNMGQLAWFSANVTGEPVDVIRDYMTELLDDRDLHDHVTQETLSSGRRWISDPVARWGRRLGWYAIVRAMQPEHVVETGTDKGLGSVALAAALLRNGHGRLTTVDVNPAAGSLVSGLWAEVVDYVQGNSHDVLRDMEKSVDLFIHDSLHTIPHESVEYEMIQDKLTRTSLMLSDNAHCHPTLMQWAEENGWRFLYFQEAPENHWYRGAGIGAAFHEERSLLVEVAARRRV